MANLKSLAKDTAIYGLSSIVGRFLNYLLVSLYTVKLAAESGGYGIITNLYAYAALLIVLLTFGMETSFFRFVNKEEEDAQTVYSTTLMLVGGVGIIYLLLLCLFHQPLAVALGYEAHPDYVFMLFACVAFDAFQCIPFAYLRYKKRPIKFATLKLLFIIVNITLNLLFFLILPAWNIVNIDVVYAFGINLFCSVGMTFFFYKELTGFKYVFDKILAKRMLTYAWPILVLGIAGILNQTADKIIYPLLKPTHQGHVELGIYGACVKIAMIMAMITQAFRFAYEPFVFGNAKDRHSRELYASAMKYFIIFTLLAYLIVCGYIDILKYLVGSSYWSGLKVVPIVMAAEIMMGIYFNLSFWYKLTDKTIWGVWFSGIGCAVLIAVNVIFIPRYGYMACAWGGVAGYGTAMLLSYFVEQKKYPIDYPLKSIFTYIVIAIVFTSVMFAIPKDLPLLLRMMINSVIILLYAGHIVYHEFPLSSLPLIGKYLKKEQGNTTD